RPAFRRSTVSTTPIWRGWCGTRLRRAARAEMNMARGARINWARYAIVAAAIALIVGAIWTLRPVFIADAPPPPTDEPAARIHGAVIAIDTHVDIRSTFAPDSYGPGNRGTYPVQVERPRMREGGLDAVFLVVYAGQRARDDAGQAQA